VPSGIGANKGAGQVFAGMIIHGEQEGLFLLGRPPLVNGGIVLPEFADAGTLPAASGLGQGWRDVEQQREVLLRVGGD